jgi:predicted rRNA methylase YqxC with S4 and FtsJ domains
VLVDGEPLCKAGAAVSSSSEVVLTAAEPKYVCRGGHNL